MYLHDWELLLVLTCYAAILIDLKIAFKALSGFHRMALGGFRHLQIVSK
jgi:hypothetical protein